MYLTNIVPRIKNKLNIQGKKINNFLNIRTLELGPRLLVFKGSWLVKMCATV